MNKLGLAARILLGLIFFVFGLNGFLLFIPPPELGERAGALMGALMETGYFIPILKITEIVGGALLLAGMFVPLALVLLAPIVVQILLFHIVLEPAGLPMAVILVLLLAPWRGRRGFLFSGLAGLAAGSHLLIDLDLVAKAPFVLGLGVAGILVAGVTTWYLISRPRAGA